jgi:hypothetical protein
MAFANPTKIEQLMRDALKERLKSYPGMVTMVYRDFPTDTILMRITYCGHTYSGLLVTTDELQLGAHYWCRAANERMDEAMAYLVGGKMMTADEYDEIMQAQAIMDELTPQSHGYNMGPPEGD